MHLHQPLLVGLFRPTNPLGETQNNCEAPEQDTHAHNAGMVSLLNEARLGAGMPPMGLLNPFLYANPDALTDITVGDNAHAFQSFQFGYQCVPGWDPVTGEQPDAVLPFHMTQ